MDNRPIGVFDSGLGGLTVLGELIKQLPDESFIFIADTKNNPYGEKTSQELDKIVRKNFEKLIAVGVKAVVIACNTASTLDIDSYRKEYGLPIITVLEATIEEVDNRYSRILVAATNATIKSNKHKILINEHFPGVQVEGVPCKDIVPEIEAGNPGDAKAQHIVDGYLSAYRFASYDALILGCTHYPIWEDNFRRALPQCKIINPASKTAYLTLNYLKTHNMLREHGDRDTSQISILVSGDEKDFKKKIKNIFKINPQNVTKL